LAFDRVRQRERREELWQQHAPLLAELAADVPAPDQAPSYEILHLEDCLSTLTQRARDIVRLSYTEARNHDEVATTLKTSVANARVLRHRTLLALRQCLGKRLSWEAA
jgi:DNA-directed RNA polymerase specialized sigma24 family protein